MGVPAARAARDSLFFQCAVEKHSFTLSSCREVRDNFMCESAHPGASAWDVSTSNFKNQRFIVGSALRLVGGFIIAEMDSHNILFYRHVASPRTSR